MDVADQGDGAGFDVESFNPDGTPRLIEVKTTGLGKYFPFNVTVNEVMCSMARPKESHLYRVFNFGPEARLNMLPGELSRSGHLDPTHYRAFGIGVLIASAMLVVGVFAGFFVTVTRRVLAL